KKRHILRAHNASPAGSRRTVPYRSPDRALLSRITMSAASLTTPGSIRHQGPAPLTYVILLAGLLATAVASISNLLESFAALNEIRAALARLDRQLQRSRRARTH